MLLHTTAVTFLCPLHPSLKMDWGETVNMKILHKEYIQNLFSLNKIQNK